MANGARSLGDAIREARVAKDITLRELARELQISPSYLSDIENDRRVPAEDVLKRIADLLDLSFDDLMALAGRFGENVERYIRRTPAAGVLFRRISEANLSEEALEELRRETDRLGGEDE